MDIKKHETMKDSRGGGGIGWKGKKDQIHAPRFGSIAKTRRTGATGSAETETLTIGPNVPKLKQKVEKGKKEKKGTVGNRIQPKGEQSTTWK